MNFNKVWNDFWQMLYSDISKESDFPETSPLLAHYTSLENMENILRGEEIWLSNPLNMNDLEEVRFGVNHGKNLISDNDKLHKALGTDEMRTIFFRQLKHAYREYDEDHVQDLYVICFSLHSEDDSDGRLSMWRGYGENGKGAAIVFDTSKINAIDDSPLAMAAVEYASSDDRKASIVKKIEAVAEFIERNEISKENIHSLASALFQRICLFAIFSKHIGFSEEKEWRIAYLKDRDQNKLVSKYFSYFNGPRGMEPKLKLPLRPIKGVIDDGFDISQIVHSIIIGPTSSSPLSKLSVERMLDSIGKPELKERIKMSTIPFRG